MGTGTFTGVGMGMGMGMHRHLQLALPQRVKPLVGVTQGALHVAEGQQRSLAREAGHAGLLLLRGHGARARVASTARNQKIE
jgi:hypothetical protein|tara:strand:- start:25 stop:270 length:246 start_codon:yes stop_codon:yes gene_type:complete